MSKCPHCEDGLVWKSKYGGNDPDVWSEPCPDCNGPDPDLLREDRDERRRLEKDDGEIREYQEREIYMHGRYVRCQILNWEDGPPPQFLICNPLHKDHSEEFLAHQAMGTWARCDLRAALRKLQPTRPTEEALRAEVERGIAFAEAIIEGYPNPEINHVDFRVQVTRWAEEFKETARAALHPKGDGE